MRIFSGAGLLIGAAALIAPQASAQYLGKPYYGQPPPYYVPQQNPSPRETPYYGTRETPDYGTREVPRHGTPRHAHHHRARPVTHRRDEPPPY